MSLETLRVRFGDKLADALAKLLSDRIAMEIEPALFAEELGLTGSLDKVGAFLAEAAKLGLVEEVEAFRCSSCSGRLDADAVAQGQCPSCGKDFHAEGLSPIVFKVYRISGGRTRDIPWLVVIHGMNSAGTWQEEFSWRIATKLKYSAPVFIYKYGFLRFGVLARWRHLMLARRLGRRLQQAFDHAAAQNYTEPPDVVIHSFGSQLFVLLLDMEEFRALNFGRVIAAGAIVDPNYNWSAKIDEGRIEAVLNHRGGRDSAVPWAQFAIPRTGPGARKGFSDAKAINLLSPDFGHSDCFTPDALVANLEAGGAWDSFLRLPLENFEHPLRKDPIRWRPIPRWITFPLRLGFIAALAMAAFIVACLFGYGLVHGWAPVWTSLTGFAQALLDAAGRFA